MWASLLSAACLLLILLLWLLPAPADKVVFLDVGQGDAILLQDGTRQVLIDGGQGMAVLRRLGEELPWFDRRIEVVIATHPDRDHLEGLVHVIERYEVGLVLLPQMSHTSQLQSAWLEELQGLLDERKVAYRFAWQGQHLRMSESLQLQLLAPFAEEGEIYAPGGKTNNATIIARADFGGLSVLLTSDAEASVERRLVETYGRSRASLTAASLTPGVNDETPGVFPAAISPARGESLLDVDILKAGHHGSKTSTTPELLAAASPGAVVISVGEDNRYGHPHPTVLARLERLNLWRTDEDGSVQFVREGGRWLAPCVGEC